MKAKRGRGSFREGCPAYHPCSRRPANNYRKETMNTYSQRIFEHLASLKEKKVEHAVSWARRHVCFIIKIFLCSPFSPHQMLDGGFSNCRLLLLIKNPLNGGSNFARHYFALNYDQLGLSIQVLGISPILLMESYSGCRNSLVFIRYICPVFGKYEKNSAHGVGNFALEKLWYRNTFSSSFTTNSNGSEEYEDTSGIQSSTVYKIIPKRLFTCYDNNIRTTMYWIYSSERN